MILQERGAYPVPADYFCNITSLQVADKKNFVLRLDEDVYKALEKWAGDEFRSVNGQIEWLIDAALKKAGRKATPKPKPTGKKDDA
jgi:hypothetical protein